MAENATAGAAEQLNLKVKSQVNCKLIRMEKRSSSRSRARPSSRNSWMPIARGKVYFCSYSAECQQRSLPL